MDRHTFLGFLMLSLLIGSAVAANLPSAGQVVLVSADGVVAGTGTLDRGNLELELLAGFEGFGTMTVIGEAGEVFVYDVMVQAGGAVVLTESLDDLATLIRGAGGTVDVSLRQGGRASGGATAGAATVDDVGVGEGPEAAEPAVEVPERANDVKETVEDVADRTADEIGDEDAIGRTDGGILGAADEVTGAGDADIDDVDDPAGARTETEPDGSADEGDRSGDGGRRGEDALPTPEVPRLP